MLGFLFVSGILQGLLQMYIAMFILFNQFVLKLKITTAVLLPGPVTICFTMNMERLTTVGQT
jgi:hypothetical protein